MTTDYKTYYCSHGSALESITRRPSSWGGCISHATAASRVPRWWVASHCSTGLVQVGGSGLQVTIGVWVYYRGRNNCQYYSGGSLLYSPYNGPQNPTLIIKAPTVGFGKQAPLLTRSAKLCQRFVCRSSLLAIT